MELNKEFKWAWESRRYCIIFVFAWIFSAILWGISLFSQMILTNIVLQFLAIIFLIGAITTSNIETNKKGTLNNRNR